MSDLSEEVYEALKFHEELEDEEKFGGLVDIDASGYLKKIPLFEEFRGYYGQEVTKQVRRVMRLHAGATNWCDANEAMNAVKKDFMDRFLPMTFNALADGIQLGRTPTPVIKKYKMFDKERELFENQSFRTDSALEAVRLTNDPDLYNGMYRFVLGAVYATGAASGYKLVTTPDEGPGVHKIYELWALAMNSIMISAYQAGVRLGRKWDETDTLQGILSATEGGES